MNGVVAAVEMGNEADRRILAGKMTGRVVVNLG